MLRHIRLSVCPSVCPFVRHTPVLCQNWMGKVGLGKVGLGQVGVGEVGLGQVRSSIVTVWIDLGRILCRQ